jgi:hypothetical protein
VAQAFERAAPHIGASERQIEAVGRHRSRVAIRAPVHRGQLGPAQSLVQGLSPLLPRALGVFVRSSGKAHSVIDWRQLRPDQPYDLLRGFVVVGRQELRSWGMKNFGLPDLSLAPHLFPQTASALLESLLADLLCAPDAPTPTTYEIAPGVPPRVRLKWTAAPPHDNPFGILQLEPE